MKAMAVDFSTRSFPGTPRCSLDVNIQFFLRTFQKQEYRSVSGLDDRFHGPNINATRRYKGVPDYGLWFFHIQMVVGGHVNKCFMLDTPKCQRDINFCVTNRRHSLKQGVL